MKKPSDAHIRNKSQFSKKTYFVRKDIEVDGRVDKTFDFNTFYWKKTFNTQILTSLENFCS